MRLSDIRNGTRCAVLTSGEVRPLDGPVTMDQCQAIIAPRSALDSVNLRHLGEPVMVMVVDDTGMIDRKPINEVATALYHANCYPGNPFSIHGDAVVAPDSDFAAEGVLP